MKNLYVFNVNTRGAMYGIGTYIEQLAKCSIKKDMNVYIVEINASCEEFKVETKNGIRYIYIPWPSVYPSGLGFARLLTIIQNYIPFFLKEFVKQGDENIFHLNRMEFLPLAKNLKAYFDGKIVLTMHYTNWSMLLLGDKTKLRRILKKHPDSLVASERQIYDEVIEGRELINDYCDKIIAISQHSYNDIISVYEANPEKVVLINNALQDHYRPASEEKKTSIRQEFHIGANEMVLIYAGRVDEVKGIFVLVAAFIEILKTHPHCRLIIAGSGQLDAVMEQAKYVASKITFTGFVPKKTLYRLYSVADIGIVPSIHEEFGYVALEMMMHNIPVVASDTTGLAEIIENNVTGLKTTLKRGKRQLKASAVDLAATINRLIENESMRKQYGNNGRKRFKDRYSYCLFEKRMVELYNNIIKNQQ